MTNHEESKKRPIGLFVSTALFAPLLALFFVGQVVPVKVTYNALLERTSSLPDLESEYLSRQFLGCIEQYGSSNPATWVAGDSQDKYIDDTLNRCARTFVLNAETLTHAQERNHLLERVGMAPFVSTELAARF